MFSHRRFVAVVAVAFAATLQLGATANPAFDKFVDEYYASGFRWNPNAATETGVHDYDREMNTKSKAAIEARVAELKKQKDTLEKIDPATLTKDEKLDRELLVSGVNSELLELESIQGWKHNPDSYSSNASAEIFALIKRNFAPAQERLVDVIAREGKIPELLANAKVNLENCPKIYTEIALEQLPGTIDFFKTAVPNAFKEVTDAKLQADFAKSNAATIAALEDYQQFLKTEILPKGVENFAIGKDNYQKKLAYEEMVDEPVEVLLERGNQELKRLQKAFIDTAKQIDPNKDPREVYAAISSDHPAPDQLLSSVNGVLSTLRDRSLAVVTIPTEQKLMVQETPPFLRALTFASMDAPGPLETKAKEAYYQVTLPEKDWTAKKTEEHMRFFCKDDLINTGVHEAYPGHYVQGLWMRQAPSKVRKLSWCGSNSEGWAHYCEEMMADETHADPKLRMVQIHDALLRASRYIVGIRMHTQGMTMDEARKFFVDEGYQEAANGDRETKRGTMDPTYLVYTLGKLQILQLRDDYKKAKGEQYSLKDFHDKFLAQGCPPIKLVRRAMLEQ